MMFCKCTLIFPSVLNENKLAQFEFSTATGKCGAERRVHDKISLTAVLVT